MLLLLELARLAFDPVLATLVGSLVAGEPQLAKELLSICRRESHCRPVGAHVKDMPAGPTMHRKAMARDWLADDCIWHRGDPYRFSTRGVHGISAAYSLRFVGRCLPPEALDIPIVSAYAAAKRSRFMCDRHGACDRQQRHRRWVGTAKYDRQHPRVD
ncbi:MAG: hypothetical protein AAF721_28015 [Myxococcota bacterium]